MRSMFLRLLTGTSRAARPARPRRRGRRAPPSIEPLERRFALAAFEIAYLGNLGADYTGPTQVYLAAGTNPMTTAAWDAYVPPAGYIKNTTRNVEFNSQDVLASPDSPTEETSITTSDDYTWLFVAETVSANWPFDPADYDTPYASGYQAAALSTTPPPGVIKYSANTKNAFQQITWGAAGRSIAQQIPGMFIWGGTTPDTLLGRRGQDNLIHGAQGNDRIIAVGSNDRLQGDQGIDTVVFQGRRSHYLVTPLTADGSRVEVRTRFGGDRARVATLFDVERIQFQDRLERTADLGRILWLKWLVFSPSSSQPVAFTPRARR